jgi:hypothetical protein
MLWGLDKVFSLNFGAGLPLPLPLPVETLPTQTRKGQVFGKLFDVSFVSSSTSILCSAFFVDELALESSGFTLSFSLTDCLLVFETLILSTDESPIRFDSIFEDCFI